jgi:hypothetical protein
MFVNRSCLGEDHIQTLASLVRDLDREMGRGGHGKQGQGSLASHLHTLLFHFHFSLLFSSQTSTLFYDLVVVVNIVFSESLFDCSEVVSL